MIAHQVYCRLAIIIRNGATNIADYLAFRVRIPPVVLALGLVILLALLAWQSQRSSKPARANGDGGLPDTGADYWTAMQTVGVLGTVLGDDASRLIGQGPASIALGVLLGLVLLLTRGAATPIFACWGTPGCAQTNSVALDAANKRPFVACRGSDKLKPAPTVMNSDTGAGVFTAEIGEGE